MANQSKKIEKSAAEKKASRIERMSRGEIESALTSGLVDPHDAHNHQNQHVRRSAWRLLGAEVPEGESERKALADKLYPNHFKRIEPLVKALADAEKKSNEAAEAIKAATSAYGEVADASSDPPEEAVEARAKAATACAEADASFTAAEKEYKTAKANLRHARFPTVLKNILNLNA